MTTPFKRIGLFGRTGTHGVNETLQSLIDYLESFDCSICIESETAESFGKTTLPVIPKNQLGSQADLLIVVGGDGSLLHAAHTAVDQKLSVLGINRGSLGFLTDILPKELDQIGHILKGNYFIEERFLLNATIISEAATRQDDALNEVAIMPAAFPHMIEFEIYINNEFVCSQHADGIIAATPTGSTAYALSGGGPILHPTLNAIVLVPMFPHSLNNRPIVVSGDSEVSVIISSASHTVPRLSCDGHDCIATPAGSKIILRKKTRPLKLVHPTNYSYYEALRSKLHWGKKLTHGE